VAKKVEEREDPEMNERPDRTDPAPTVGASGMVETQPGRTSVALPPVVQSIAASRRAVDALLGGAAAAEQFRFFLRLVVSELVTNAIVHANPKDDIRLDLALYRRHAHVSVTSTGNISMTKLRRGRADGGRGLEIVAAVSERWVIDAGPHGTTITARIPLP
jgi:anti-sigma regulatory factor (Ser/Thr protein kinase)